MSEYRIEHAQKGDLAQIVDIYNETIDSRMVTAEISIYISSAFRGQGIGGLLIEKVIADMSGHCCEDSAGFCVCP
ncbi:hypothetical protein D3C77_310500 [compost metagenome]